MVSKRSLLGDKDMETKDMKTLYAVKPAKMEEIKREFSQFNIAELQARCTRIDNVFNTFSLCYEDKGVTKGISQCKPVNDYISCVGNKNKSKMLNVIAFFLSDSRNFAVYLDALPATELKVWKYTVDHFYISESTFKLFTKCKMFKKSSYGYYYGYNDKNDALLFFSVTSMHSRNQYNYTNYACLYPLFQALAYEYFYPKKDDKINSLAELTETGLHVLTDSEAETCRLLPLVKMLCQAKKLTLSKTGKLLLPQVKRAKDELNIKEYFPASTYKEQACLRSSLMLMPLINYFQEEGLSSNKPIQKQMIDIINISVDIAYDMFRPLFLAHIKGLKAPLYTDLEDQSEAILDIVGEFPKGWVSADEILRLLRKVSNKSEFYMFYSPSEYMNMSIQNSKTNDTVDFGMLYDELFVPYVKAMLFMLNSLGVLDVAYADAKDSDRSYVAPLRYVRLTGLGRYIFGQTSEYKPQKVEHKDYYELDSMTLLVRVLDESNPYRSVLEDVATKAGANRYKVTENSFLKNCTTEEDVKDKMDSFVAIMGKDMPDVWKHFFTSLKSKLRPMKHVPISNYALYKVDKDDKELLRLLVTDEILKSNVIRAEGCMLLIDQKKLPDVVLRLKHFGYML